MYKMKFILLLLVLIASIAGCETKEAATKEIEAQKTMPEEIKSTIPLNERRFIYHNGIKIDYKEVSSLDKNKIKVVNYYPIISGLKNKGVQGKINAELQEIGMKLLSELEASVMSRLAGKTSRIEQKRASADITYNYNNVLFVDYNAVLNVDYKADQYFATFKSAPIGYDLNTGEKIKLADLFKPKSKYKTLINNYICQYIIENNYDDYETNRMSKPFQGIRENQSFTIGMEGLRIILDEKNDEFALNGYPEHIFIPLKSFGDELYLFDRYFDEGISIFESERLSKKLFPNQLEYRVNEFFEEGNEKYFISISHGEFVNVPDKAIEKKLNEMIAFKSDIEGFKEQAEASTGINQYAHFSHYVNVFTNAGGYLSMTVAEEAFINNKLEAKRIPFNYDFNLNKEIQLKDIFVDKLDIQRIVKPYISKLDNSLTEEMLTFKAEEAIKDSIFYFDESGISINFSPEGTKLNPYEAWVYILFEEIGLENVKILN